MAFTKATKENLFLRLALQGPSGSGKTRSALEIAKYLGDRIALIDTEERSSCRFAHLYDFDVEHLDDGHPNKYIQAIREASGSYDVLIIDSFTHAWFWELQAVDKVFGNWATVRPLERQLVKAIVSFPGHVIVTMRSKTEWVLESGTNKRGKATTVPRRVGTAAIQSPGVEYEFDAVGELDLQHVLRVSKTRFDGLDGIEVPLPGKDFADQLLQSLLIGGTAVSSVPTVTNSQRIRDLLDELGVTDRMQRRTLGSQYLQGRKSAALTEDEIVAVLASIRQSVEDSKAEDTSAEVVSDASPGVTQHEGANTSDECAGGVAGGAVAVAV